MLPLLALGAYQAAVFGSPFATPYAFRVDAPQHASGFLGLGLPDLEVLKRLLDSEYRGFFVYGGAAAVGFFTCWVWGFWDDPWGDGLAQAIGRTAILIWSSLWILNGGMTDWWAGAGWGPRYLLPAVPFLALGAAPVVEWIGARPRGRRAVFALLLAGYCLAPSLLGVLGGPPPWEEESPLLPTARTAIDRSFAPAILDTVASPKSPFARSVEFTPPIRVAIHALGLMAVGALGMRVWKAGPRKTEGGCPPHVEA
ncbi:MAG: hypothetical protein HYY93_15865 [Planctomycetes bacterium]|nr:hypothetical protein [Planctomycetota bacterium]